MNLKKFVRECPDYPKKGILFKDISPLLSNTKVFEKSIDSMEALVKKEIHSKIDAIVAPEARGFIFGIALAARMGKGFVMARKHGKLPGETVKGSYALEYGTATLEMPKGVLKKNSKVLIVDDVLATGGTAKAIKEMVEKLGSKVVGIICAIELTDIPNKIKLPFNSCSVIKYKS